MSGIAGIWHLDGQPLDALALDRMSARLAHRGRDGVHARIDGAAGVAHQHLWVTPEEIGEIQPLIGSGGVLVAMDGRLDNRRDLIAALECPKSLSDAALVLAAYEAWGEDLAVRLAGDFALAIVDRDERRILLARDAIGARPLYYARRGALFLFASEIKAILAHPEMPAEADDEGLADFLLVSSRPVDGLERTCFAGISAVVPSHVVVASPEATRVRRYWDFDPGRRIRLGSVGEYADAFREHFAEAVARRTRSAHPIAFSVSGGLDSSSIFCQAERLRRAGSTGGGPLVGVTFAGPSGTTADERRYVEAIEREYGVTIDAIPLEPLTGLVDEIDTQVTATEAPLVDYMWRSTAALNARAAASGARQIVSGHWGDQVLFSPAYLVDLFGEGRWPTVVRHLGEYGRWFGSEEARVLTKRFPINLARHHLPRALVPPFKWARRRLFGVERPRPWFSDAFLGRALRFASRPATLGDGFHSAQARSIYFEARSKHHVHCLEWHNKTTALWGMDPALPFLDRDLLAFLMAIPGELQNPGGVPRGLAREAMRGILPEAIRARGSKGDFTGLVNLGVAADIGAVTAALSPESLGVRLGYFDAGRLGPAVRNLASGLTRPDCLDSWDLADAFGFEVWLRIFLSGR